MYGLKVKRSELNRYLKLEPGRVWVDDDEENYTTKAKAKRYATKEDAEKAITEPWEDAVELK